MRRPSAIRRFKQSCRKIKRDRAKQILEGTPPGRTEFDGVRHYPAAKPVHISSDRPTAVRSPTGEWYVFSAPKAGPPFVQSRQIAGPFDSRDEAQTWIDEQPSL